MKHRALKKFQLNYQKYFLDNNFAENYQIPLKYLYYEYWFKDNQF